jgi:hypothetical protein
MVSPIRATQDENKLPKDAAAALHTTGKVILYSLEPWSMVATNDNTLHGYKILGQQHLMASRQQRLLLPLNQQYLRRNTNFTQPVLIRATQFE